MIFYTEYSKIFIGLGASNKSTDFSDDFEIIDLASNTSTCPGFPKFPRKVRNVYGGLGYMNETMICGGQDEQSIVHMDCYLYIHETWRWSTQWMSNFYEGGSFASNPDVMGDGRIVVSGGLSGQVMLINVSKDKESVKF